MYSDEDVEAFIQPYRYQIEMLNNKLQFYEAQLRAMTIKVRETQAPSREAEDIEADYR